MRVADLQFRSEARRLGCVRSREFGDREPEH